MSYDFLQGPIYFLITPLNVYITNNIKWLFCIDNQEVTTQTQWKEKRKVFIRFKNILQQTLKYPFFTQMNKQQQTEGKKRFFYTSMKIIYILKVLKWSLYQHIDSPCISYMVNGLAVELTVPV